MNSLSVILIMLDSLTVTVMTIMTTILSTVLSLLFVSPEEDIIFGRFCTRCKQDFLRYFTRKLNLIEKNTCLAEIRENG